MTRIHQVTDIHIPVSGDMGVRDNFIRLMAHTADEKPDLLVISGDLPAEDGNREAYEWVLGQLPNAVPTMIMPGNHDDPEILFEVFQSDCNRHPDFFEHMALDDIDLVFVNTASNSLPDDQMNRLGNESIRPGSVLFIHHPTKVISSGFMDVTYPLQNREAVDRAIAASNVSEVFCGHFHTCASITDDYNLHVTPSPAFDVDPDSVEPIIGPPRVPVREIQIDGASVSSQVRYLD